MTTEVSSSKTESGAKPALVPRTGFGTFGGVFTPCTLTILGVIMFLRFDHVVGRSGILYAIVIVLISKAITLLTTLSLSAIATNTRVKGGGAYFLISRSLGVEFGGAIGLIFFLAQAIAVSMYVFGFSEAFIALFPEGAVSLTVVASVVNVLVFVSVFIGAGWTIKLQYFILAVLGLSMASFFIGAAGLFNVETLQSNWRPAFNEKEGFFIMFALFFPAVTGIMAGANMSGDLRDPAKSIPRGTLLSVVVTGAIYLTMALVLGGVQPREALLADGKLVVSEVAVWPLLITAGIFAATLSSALGSMMGAPRILQAFARDNVIPGLRAFGAGSGKAAEPRRAIVLTFVISQACIMAADLDTVAPLITMAFMITYGLLNLATFYEAITRNPSYRPRFRFSHWSTSLLGAIGCLAVMFLISWQWALASIAIMATLHWAIGRKEVEARWGDVQSGLLFERARRNLLKLEDELQHPKNWRPIIVALSGAGWDRPHLAIFGHWFTAGHGILTLAQIIQGEVEEKLERRVNQERILHSFIRQQQLEAFPAVVVAPYVSEGIEAIVQCQGLGALRPNTVVLGWPGDIEKAESFGASLRTIEGLQRSIVCMRIADEPDDPWEVPKGTIDVWWRGHKNGELMLLLAHLLTKNSVWRGHQIRLLRVIDNEAGSEDVLSHLNQLLESSRIRATSQVVVSQNPQRAIQIESRAASLVFLGFESAEEGSEQNFFARMENWVGDLPRVVLVNSVGGMSLEN